MCIRDRAHLRNHDIFCHKSHWFCGLVQNHPQDVVVFILNTATESGWLSPWDPPLQWGKDPERINRPATHPIHFAADSPDKIIAALRGRFSVLKKAQSYSAQWCFCTKIVVALLSSDLPVPIPWTGIQTNTQSIFPILARCVILFPLYRNKFSKSSWRIQHTVVFSL